MSLAVPDRWPTATADRLPGTIRFDAFGGQAVVAVVDSARLPDARRVVERVVSEFDQACSRFREDSELTAVNASAGRPVRVSPLLLEAVGAALRAARLTDGKVDPTVGQALVALGYDRDFSELAPAAGRQATSIPTPRLAAAPGWRTIGLDETAGTVTVPRGVRLDLGATAKALAADRAAELAAAAAGCGVLVSMSGDMAIAGPAPSGGWRIRVTDDHRSGPDAAGQWIALRSGGLATSSTTVRRWRTEEGSRHHLVDPATGASIQGRWRTASVAAVSCLDANIASTAAIIGNEGAIDWLQSLGLPSRLVSVEGTVRHLAGWPAGGEDLPLAEASAA